MLATTSKAGIITDDNGIRHIPSSVRADGSIRKEIRIKPGYRPPEDVELYRNRTAEAFRTRGNSVIPGAEAAEHPTEVVANSANKNAKRRAARKKAAVANIVPIGNSKQSPEIEACDHELDLRAEKDKQGKKLAKKLRQARELKKRKDDGDVLLPEQLEKVIKISELLRQLEALGFDQSGETKDVGSAQR